MCLNTSVMQPFVVVPKPARDIMMALSCLRDQHGAGSSHWVHCGELRVSRRGFAVVVIEVVVETVVTQFEVFNFSTSYIIDQSSKWLEFVTFGRAALLPRCAWTHP